MSHAVSFNVSSSDVSSSDVGDVSGEQRVSDDYVGVGCGDFSLVGGVGSAGCGANTALLVVASVMLAAVLVAMFNSSTSAVASFFCSASRDFPRSRR